MRETFIQGPKPSVDPQNYAYVMPFTRKFLPNYIFQVTKYFVKGIFSLKNNEKTESHET